MTKEQRIAQELASHWHNIGMEMHTDKATHTYMSVYERFLGPLASDPLRILEIGIERGASLRLWLKLFPNASVFALDYRFTVEVPRDDRITAFLGRYQQDPDIANLFPLTSLDVIIDDGGHYQNLQRDTLQILWPCLKVGGYYFIEDILTDVYPDEVDHWAADNQCIFTEANKHDIYGKYERADAICVFRKTHERDPWPLMTPLDERFTDYSWGRVK